MKRSESGCGALSNNPAFEGFRGDFGCEGLAKCEGLQQAAAAHLPKLDTRGTHQRVAVERATLIAVREAVSGSGREHGCKRHAATQALTKG